MTQKTISEKNLWQRFPVRWRVIFLFLVLVLSSYAVRHFFPMEPSLREGQSEAQVKAFRVETVFESPSEVVGELPSQVREVAEKEAKGMPRKARVSGVYVSKLVETGEPVRIAYREFFHADPDVKSAEASDEETGNGEESSAWEESVESVSKTYGRIRKHFHSSKNDDLEHKWLDKIITGTVNVATQIYNYFRKAPQAPVLLIHGVGADGRELDALAEALAANGVTRVIVPDLPGAGASQREVEDYSIEATAGTLFSLLDDLKVGKVNILGFGEGGGVAIYMAHQQPDRVNSMALVSSVGAQEFELLGNHIVNKIVYTFHLGFFKVVQDFLPHFGLMDRGNINKAYARVLWDSDISELKKYIYEWDGPLFIAHGKGDLIAPFAAAEYSAALAPQAQTLFEEGGHDALLNDPKKLADDYGAFLVRLTLASEYEELKRSEESQSAKNTEAGYVYPPIDPAGGMRVIVLMLVILVCTFVAEDPTCLAAGLLVAQGLIDFIPATVACLVGIFIGDLVLYLIGRFLGRPILRKPPLKWLVSEQQIDEMSDRFSKNPKGLALIVSSRFIPGSRVPTFVAAGIMKLDWHKLIFLFFIAAALWTPPLILLAEKVGASVIEQFKEWHHNAAWIVVGAIVALWLLTHYIIPAFTWRGRRRHVMIRRQWTRHEFWPHFILATPVMLYYLWQSVLYRSFTLFTLANRSLGEDGGMPAGSKFEHYTRFLNNTKNPEVAAVSVKTALIPSNENLDARLDLALGIMQEHGIDFPCVMKPEIGDGGVGVYIVRSQGHLRNWLEVNVDAAVVQEFVGGNEYEVVWSRRPGRSEGRIQTVVQKDFVLIKGDGERKLEDLIWADDKGVSNGKLFSKINFRAATYIPAAGESYALAPIGSRIRGANFISRPELRAGSLSNAIDRLADACGDVHFLVLDIRAESDEALMSGKNIRITGVKGAGATAGTLFDGYVRMGMAYSRMFKQLNFCFGVGAEIRDEQGAKPTLSAFRLFERWGTARGRSDNYVKTPPELDA